MPAQVTPLPKKPRRGQDPFDHIVEQITRLHDCVHSVGEEVKTVGDRVNGVSERVSKLEGYQAGIATRLGVPTEEGAKAKPIKGVLGWKQNIGLIAAIFGAVTAAVGAYPYIVAILAAINETLLRMAG